MIRIHLFLVVSAVLCWGVQAADNAFGDNLIDVKISLPKGDTYLRGVTDPVADLIVNVSLTNRTVKENRNKEIVAVPTVARLSAEELAVLQAKVVTGKLTMNEQIAEVTKKKSDMEITVYPINKDSLGYDYVEPQLGPHDNIDFIITKLPEEGETAPDKPQHILRDNKPDSISKTDLTPKNYLAAGETSPDFPLCVGKYYLINNPGRYSIKAVLRLIADTGKPTRLAESNEETFRVLPFKIVPQKIEELQNNWQEYERGVPTFDYLLYQVKTSAQWDEIYYVQRVPVRKLNRWEWTRLCTVKAGTQAQIAQLAPKKVAVLAVHHKGDAGLYTLDFTTISPKVTAKILEVKGDAAPKLKVEGGAVNAE
ncbi:MAG: hypothetical protein V1899_12580 [Planctomycetota bacterium]